MSLTKYKWQILAILSSVFVLVACVMPGGVHTGVAQGDKILHLLTFIALALIYSLAFKGSVIKTIVICVLFGGLIEIIQGSLAWRSAEWMDLSADILGAIIGIGICQLIRYRRMKINGSIK